MKVKNSQAPTISEGSTGDAAQLFQLRFGPFLLLSEIDIPELPRVSECGEIVVSVRLGAVPEALAGGVAFAPGCEASGREYLLEVPDIGRFYAGFGREVRVEAHAGVAVSDVTIYLLGSVFGALCHQNGLLPLHASAVEKDGVMTAFLGDSGAGKSTLAACLQRRGARVVADDICLLDEEGEDGMRVIPVGGWLKLWRESMEHLGETPEERNRTFSEDDKYRVYLDVRAGGERRLGRVVLLARAEENQRSPVLTRLSAAEAIAGMMEFTYLAYLPELTGGKERLFRQCARALEGAEAYRLTMPWGLERMEELLDFLERAWCGV